MQVLCRYQLLDFVPNCLLRKLACENVVTFDAGTVFFNVVFLFLSAVSVIPESVFDTCSFAPVRV